MARIGASVSDAEGTVTNSEGAKPLCCRSPSPTIDSHRRLPQISTGFPRARLANAIAFHEPARPWSYLFANGAMALLGL